MSRRPSQNLKNRVNKRGLHRSSRRARLSVMGKRGTRGSETGRRGPFVPPEDWHEPNDESGDYHVIEQDPGPGYCHVITANDVCERLALLPPEMLEPLDVVQLSRMTRKKLTYPCYGMQWGSALYLYPLEVGLTEYFDRPPLPEQRREATMFGGTWENDGTAWRLLWTPETIRDYYLNNVLIHELGHLLDDRNTNFADRERFADWFAIEHGYKRSRRSNLARRAARKATRRHHRK